MSARFNTNASQLNEAITRTACAHAQAMVAFDFYDKRGDKKMADYYNHRYFATLDHLDALGVLDDDNGMVLTRAQSAAMDQTLNTTRAELTALTKHTAQAA